MKRKLKMVSAAVLATATLAAAGCEFDPDNNKNDDLYASPSDDFDPEKNIEEPLYASPMPDEWEGEWDNIEPEFDPEENKNQDLYGVPEELEEEPDDAPAVEQE